jgi:hypothetical protein
LFAIIGRNLDRDEALKPNRLGRYAAAAWRVLELSLVRGKPESQPEIADGSGSRHSKGRQSPHGDEPLNSLEHRFVLVARPPEQDHTLGQLGPIPEPRSYCDGMNGL